MRPSHRGDAVKAGVALCLALGLAVPALADTAADRFAPKRGFSTATWVEWHSVADMLSTPGFLDIYPDYARHLPAGSFARLAQQGFDTVRIAADPSPLLALESTARQDGLLVNLRQRVVEAQAAGLKVILDLHSYPHVGETGDIDAILKTPAKFAAYLRMVRRVGQRLADLDPDRTALEVMNEPTQDCAAIAANPGTSDWPVKLAQLHDTARKAAPKLPLVLSGACWGGSKGLSVLDPAALHDDNVIWSFHSYDPFTFTHQGADWTASPLVFLHGLPYPPTRLTDAEAARLVAEAVARAKASKGLIARAATERVLAQIVADYRASSPADLAAPIAEAVSWADAHAIPHDRLLLEEFGALWFAEAGQKLDPASHNRFLTAKREAAEAAGIGWAVWSLSGNFAIADADFHLYPGVCVALGLTPC